MGEHKEKPATWKPALTSPDPVGTLISDFQTPELWECIPVAYKLPSLYFVIVPWKDGDNIRASESIH